MRKSVKPIIVIAKTINKVTCSLSFSDAFGIKNCKTS